MRTLALTTFALFLTSSATAQVSFRGLGDLPGGGFYSEAQGVSGDGSTGIGAAIVGGSGFSQLFAGFAATESGIVTVYDRSGEGVTARAMGGSFNAQTIVGYADHGSFSPLGVQAFVWMPATGAVEIGDLPGGSNGVPHSLAMGVSDDGLWVACQGQSVNGDESFFYHTATGAMTPIGDLPGGQYGSFARGLSRDGSTMVGVGYSGFGQEACRAMRTGSAIPMGFLPTLATQTKFSTAEAANQDGSVIVGESASANTGGNGYEAFRWTAAGGMQPLGDLPGGAFQSWAYAVSADGSVVVGRASVQGACGPFGCGSIGHAFIWDAAHGLRDVQVLLASLGANIAGWTLTEARGVSADGATIVGNGTDPQGRTQAWLATLPRCGTADFNHDGDTGTDQDIEAFFRCLAGSCCAGCGTADFNGDGDVGTDGDIEGFFRVLAGGSC